MRDVKIRKKKTCFDTGKIGFCHCTSVLQAQVPKLCTDLDLSLLYILIFGTHTNSHAKLIFQRSAFTVPQVKALSADRVRN